MERSVNDYIFDSDFPIASEKVLSGTHICEALLVAQVTERGHHIRLKIVPFQKELLIRRHHEEAFVGGGVALWT